MAAIRRELADIAAALGWMVSQARYRLVKGALYSYGMFYHRQGWYREGKTIFAQVIHTLEQSCVLGTDDFQGKLNEAQQCLEKSLCLRRDVGDRLGETEALLIIGTVAVHQGRYDMAEGSLRKGLALAWEVNAKWSIAEMQTQLGTLLLFDEDYGQAKQQLEAALTLFQQLALDRFSVAALVLLAEIATRQTQWDEADVLLQQGLHIAQRLNFREGLALCLQQLGILAQQHDQYQDAQQYFDASHGHAQAIGHGLRIAWACYHRAQLALCQDKFAQAVLCFSEAMTRAMRMGGDLDYIDFNVAVWHKSHAHGGRPELLT